MKPNTIDKKLQEMLVKLTAMRMELKALDNISDSNDYKTFQKELIEHQQLYTQLLKSKFIKSGT